MSPEIVVVLPKSSFLPRSLSIKYICDPKIRYDMRCIAFDVPSHSDASDLPAAVTDHRLRFVSCKEWENLRIYLVCRIRTRKLLHSNFQVGIPIEESR